MAPYRICGLVVDSDVPLPEAPTADTAGVQCRVRWRSGHAPAAPAAWLHEWRHPSGEIWLSIGRIETGYLLRFSGLADFVVSTDAGEVICAPGADLPDATTRHLLLDQVLPLVVSMRGRVALHASAVAGAEGAFAFLGATGQGKSTLGASLARDGLRLLTDDCLVLEEIGGRLIAVPGYPGLRLWPEVITSLFANGPTPPAVAHYTEKRRLDADHGGPGFCDERVPLRHVFVLAPREGTAGGAETRVTPLSAGEAFIALLTHAYRLDISDRRRLGEEFERLSRAAARPLYSRLDFPRDLALLPAVRAAVLRHLGQAA